MQSKEDVCPIFIGDDITDEAGFLALRSENKQLEKNESIDNSYSQSVKDMGIKVESGRSHAHYYVNNIDEVTVLLNSFF